MSIEEALAAKKPAPGVCDKCGVRPMGGELISGSGFGRALCVDCVEDETVLHAFEARVYADPCDDCGAKPCRCDDLPNDETPPENA